MSPTREGFVLLQAIGAALPAAMAIALSPFPVIGIVLILGGTHSRTNGVLFAIGWLLGLSVVAALVIVVLGGADDPDSTSSAVADWGRVVVGSALVVMGVRKWCARRREDDETEVPAWMASLDTATPARALLLGTLLSGANPKNFVLAAAATTSIVEAGLHESDLLLAVVVFVLLSSVTVVGAVMVHFVGGSRGATLLKAIREFMVANNVVITVVILIILGGKVLGDGLSGLGR